MQHGKAEDRGSPTRITQHSPAKLERSYDGTQVHIAARRRAPGRTATATAAAAAAATTHTPAAAAVARFIARSTCKRAGPCWWQHSAA